MKQNSDHQTKVVLIQLEWSNIKGLAKERKNGLQ